MWWPNHLKGSYSDPQSHPPNHLKNHKTQVFFTHFDTFSMLILDMIMKCNNSKFFWKKKIITNHRHHLQVATTRWELISWYFERQEPHLICRWVLDIHYLLLLHLSQTLSHFAKCKCTCKKRCFCYCNAFTIQIHHFKTKTSLLQVIFYWCSFIFCEA